MCIRDSFWLIKLNNNFARSACLPSELYDLLPIFLFISLNGVLSDQLSHSVLLIITEISELLINLKVLMNEQSGLLSPIAQGK